MALGQTHSRTTTEDVAYIGYKLLLIGLEAELELCTVYSEQANLYIS